MPIGQGSRNSGRAFKRSSGFARTALQGRLARAVLAAVSLAGLGGLPGLAAGSCALEPGGSARVVSIVDGDTVLLESGREVRLVGLQAPKLALGRPNFDDWPLAAEARAYLSALLLDETVSLSYGGAREDRYGRLLAHLHLSDGKWVQADMLAAGLARVYSFADNRACVPDLLGYETAARERRRGIWALDYYAPHDAGRPRDLLRLVDTFQLVEGRVHDIATVRDRTFINFGEDWRTDFTIVIQPGDRRFFPEFLDRYTHVRVRGWIKSFNGPEIVATHPEQIELLPYDPSSF